VRPNAVGVDIGNEAHYVAVPPVRDRQPVRRFGCTAAELKDMALAEKMKGSDRSDAIYGMGLAYVLEGAVS
jgi:hypothetical protein